MSPLKLFTLVTALYYFSVSPTSSIYLSLDTIAVTSSAYADTPLSRRNSSGIPFNVASFRTNGFRINTYRSDERGHPWWTGRVMLNELNAWPFTRSSKRLQKLPVAGTLPIIFIYVEHIRHQLVFWLADYVKLWTLYTISIYCPTENILSRYDLDEPMRFLHVHIGTFWQSSMYLLDIWKRLIRPWRHLHPLLLLFSTYIVYISVQESVPIPH